MTRRTFLGTMTAAGMAGVLGSRLGWTADFKTIGPIGVQLYTVRDALKGDFEGTIAKVAAVGYREVEFAGYFDHTPQQVKAVLARNNLTAPSAHIDYASLGEKWPRVLDACSIIGHEYIVCPWIDDNVRKQPDGWKRAAETFNKAAEASKKTGVQFAYHNHNFEFVPADGKLGYDILLQETDPHLVQLEMDLCWISVAGQDPLKYFARYPGRFPLVHVKDVKHLPTQDRASTATLDHVANDEMTSVGSGSIDWKHIFANASEAGIKHYFVEHDKPKDPFASIQASYTYLRELRV